MVFQRVTYSNKYILIFSLCADDPQFADDDGLPDRLCKDCVSHLSRAFAFVQLCIESDDALRSRIQKAVEQQYLQVVMAAAAAEEDAGQQPNDTTEVVEEADQDDEDEEDDAAATDGAVVVLSTRYTIMECNDNNSSDTNRVSSR